MKSKLSLALLIAVTLFSSCTKKTGDACFDVSNTTPAIGDVVTFTSCSDNVSQQDWDFGDGSNTSSGQVVTHVYFANGNYTATLSVSGNSKFNIAQHEINVGKSRAGNYLGSDSLINQAGNVITHTDNITVGVTITNSTVVITCTEDKLATTNASIIADTFTWSKTIGSNRYEGRGEFSKANNKSYLDLFVDEYIGSSSTKNQTIRYHGQLQ